MRRIRSSMASPRSLCCSLPDHHRGPQRASANSAPTNLIRTGVFAGLVSGDISAIAYALHCTDDSLPFVAIWYGGTIVLCTVAGAILGPRLLRW